MMDTSDYLPMFLAECREHLQELNLAVVRIEEAPEDRDTIDEIFRIAHSLKGMSATMGFAAMAALTHQMEDVFELFRQRRHGLDRDGIGVLLECLDALEAATDSIDRHGEERLDPAALIARLQSLVHERSPEQQLEALGGATPADEIRARAAGRRVVHVVATLAEDVMMPAVRAYMALAPAAEHGEVLGSMPTEAGVDTFDGRTVEIWVASDHEDEAVASAVADVADVATATAETLEDLEAVQTPADLVAAGEPVADRVPAAEQPADAVSPERHRKGSATVRVDSERLDQLMHLMGELVVQRTLVESLAAQTDVPGLQQAMQDLTRSSQALQTMVMQVRMIPVDAVFMRFPRLVRDLSTQARQAGRAPARRQGHRARPDRRRRARRPARPPGPQRARPRARGARGPQRRRQAADRHAQIAARHAGGSVVIEVRDDGRGIDPARVAAQGRGARADHRATPPTPSTAEAPPSCSSRRASRPPRRRPTSPVAASGWTRCAPRSASSAARCC